jgi:hypothetical protein
VAKPAAQSPAQERAGSSVQTLAAMIKRRSLLTENGRTSLILATLAVIFCFGIFFMIVL